MKKISKKSQSFSTDVVVVVVIILFGVLFLVMNKINSQQNVDLNQKYEQSTINSKLIFEDLKTKKILNSENQVNVNKLLTLNKDEIKAQLGIKNDFAIVFEKNGKLVKIDPENNVNCIGSANIIVNGISCK